MDGQKLSNGGHGLGAGWAGNTGDFFVQVLDQSFHQAMCQSSAPSRIGSERTQHQDLYDESSAKLSKTA
jgi:hypothetical protein